MQLMNGKFKKEDSDFEIIDNIVKEDDNFGTNISIKSIDNNFDDPLDISSWNIISRKIKNIKNNLTYNLFDNQKTLKISENDSLYLFDQFYNLPKDKLIFEIDLNKLVLMTYRSNFTPIRNNKEWFSSDCGWGCMIRSGQMMLIRSILLIKSHEDRQCNEIIKQYSKKTLIDILKHFLDNEIIIDEKENSNSSIFSLRSSMMFELVDVKKPVKFTPAFSLSNICRKGLLYNAGPGKFFSDVNIVNIFKELNLELNPFSNLKVFNFSENVIYESQIIKEAFIEYIDDCDASENILCGKCTKILENGLIFKNKIMQFKNPGIIFISLRLGLARIETRYFESIKRLFTIPFNLGFIGGEKGRAFYFIGINSDNEFIYLDPHFNQKSPSDLTELEKMLPTYKPKKLFIMEFQNLSPALTFGFYFRNAYEFNTLKLMLQDFSDLDPFIKIKCDDEK